MLKKGKMTNEEIAEYTGLSIMEVEQLAGLQTVHTGLFRPVSLSRISFCLVSFCKFVSTVLPYLGMSTGYGDDI